MEEDAGVFAIAGLRRGEDAMDKGIEAGRIAAVRGVPGDWIATEGMESLGEIGRAVGILRLLSWETSRD
jgi:hypothetical protein